MPALRLAGAGRDAALLQPDVDFVAGPAPPASLPERRDAEAQRRTRQRGKRPAQSSLTSTTLAVDSHGALSPDDLSTLVQENGHKCPVSELLRVFQHEDAVKECAIRATLKGLIQLVYHKHEGSRLVRWPWASG